MNKYVKFTLITLIFLMLTPALIGFVDTVAWFWTDKTLTNLEWSINRCALAFVGGLLSVAFMGLFNN